MNWDCKAGEETFFKGIEGKGVGGATKLTIGILKWPAAKQQELLLRSFPCGMC